MLLNYLTKLRQLTSIGISHSISLSANKKYINTVSKTYLKQIRVYNHTFQNNFIRKNSFCTTKPVLNDKKVLESELQSLLIKYPNPKGVLHSFYTIVFNELKLPNQINSSCKVAPHRKGEKKREWTCTFSIKWPKEKKITATAYTKGEASMIAALKVLQSLKNEGKISEAGQPILYNKEEFKKITKNTYFPLVFNKETEKNLVNICDIYENNLKNNLENHESTVETEMQHLVDEENFSHKYSLDRQRWGSVYNYVAKELVELPINAHR